MAIELKSKIAQEEIVRQVVDNWKDMKDERAVAEQSWQRCLMAYLCEFDKGWAEYAKAAHRSRRYLPITFDAIETLTPQIYDAIFGADNWINIAPQRVGFDMNDDQWAEVMKYLLLYQHRQTGYNQTAKLAIKQLLTLGNCPWAMNWTERRAVDYSSYSDAMMEWMDQSRRHWEEVSQLQREWLKVAQQSEMMGGQAPPKPQFVEPPRPPVDSDLIFSGPKLTIGSIFNYVEEQYPNDREQAIRIMRTFRTKAFLRKEAMVDEKTGYRKYQNIDQIEDTESEDRADDMTAEQLMKSALGMTMPSGKNKVELKTQYGTFEINGAAGEKGVYENYIVTVANDSTLLQCEKAPLWSGRQPVRNARLITIEGSVYGIGVVEKALSEQDSANAIHNQTIDAVNTVIQPEYEVVEDWLSDGAGSMKPSGPGARHYVTQPGAISAIAKNYQGIPIGHDAVNAAIARHERITGAVNTAGQSNETATRTARNSGIIATKLGGHVTSIEEELITPSLNMQMEMNAQYLDEEQVFTLTQDGKAKTISVSPQDIRRGAVAYAVGSKFLGEKQERIQQLMSATQLATELKANSGGEPVPVKIPRLYQLLFKEILGGADDVVMAPEEYEEELQKFQQQMQQMQQMQAMAEGGGNGTGDAAASGGRG